MVEPEAPTAPAAGPGLGLVEYGGVGTGGRSEVEARSERNESKGGTGNLRIPPYADEQDPLATTERVVGGAELTAGAQPPGERQEGLLQETGHVPFAITPRTVPSTLDGAGLDGSTGGTIAFAANESQGPVAAADVNADGNVSAPAVTSLFEFTWLKGLLVIATLLLVAAWRVKRERGWWLGSD